MLKKSLPYVMAKYKESHNYQYIVDQLKNIIQDLQHQYIADELTVEVYEAYGRCALEHVSFASTTLVHPRSAIEKSLYCVPRS